MSRPAKSRRLTLRLDGELPFEALIQERLETLPKARRQDWLRTLLVEGFKRECRQLNKVEGRSVQPLRAAPRAFRTFPGPEVRSPNAVATAATKPDAEDRSADSAQAPVSWAALRRVIGVDAPA